MNVALFLLKASNEMRFLRSFLSYRGRPCCLPTFGRCLLPSFWLPDRADISKNITKRRVPLSNVAQPQPPNQTKDAEKNKRRPSHPHCGSGHQHAGSEKPPGNLQTGQSTHWPRLQASALHIIHCFVMSLFVAIQKSKQAPSARKLHVLYPIYLPDQDLPPGHTIPGAKLMKK